MFIHLESMIRKNETCTVNSGETDITTTTLTTLQRFYNV